MRGWKPIAGIEGGGADGAQITLADPGVGIPSALERLLSKGRLRATVYMLGPAFVASIAYVDPGNLATNVQGGARCGYLLLWAVLAANLIAMLIQYLSAKLGIVTDQSLPQTIRARWPRALTWGMWVQAEVMAMSTDIAEFLGAALGLNLLFHVPLLPAGIMTGMMAFAILELQTRGFRRFELAIAALLAMIFLGFLYETLRIGPSTNGALHGMLRRALTMIPAITVLALGMDLTHALVFSQIVLSFGIPLAVIPLVMITGKREAMGIHVNRPMTTVIAWICASAITAMNIFLVYQQFFMS